MMFSLEWIKLRDTIPHAPAHWFCGGFNWELRSWGADCVVNRYPYVSEAIYHKALLFIGVGQFASGFTAELKKTEKTAAGRLRSTSPQVMGAALMRGHI